jgi:membrane-associated phospholipid phosphatase
MRERAARDFLTGYAVLALPVFLAVLLMDRFDLHAAVNAYHSPFADTVFSHMTHLADGWVPTLLALAFLLKDHRSFLMMGASAAFSALVAQFIKHVVLPDMDRPSMFMDRMPDLMLVPGVTMLQHNSFPSGHTTAAFSMGLALSVIVARRSAAVAFVLFAAGIGLSRVYLSQHFTEDVLAGATIGTVVTWLVYRWLYASPFSTRPWLDRSLWKRQNQ